MKKLFIAMMLCVAATSFAQYGCYDSCGDSYCEDSCDTCCCCCGFGLTPYAWFPVFKGDIIIDATTVDVDSSITDMLKDSSSWLVWGLYGDWQQGCWGAHFDLFYGNLTFKKQEETTTPQDAQVDLEQFAVEFQPRYRVWQCGKRADGCPCTAFDVTAGIRYITNDITFKLADGTKLDKKLNWWEPLVGARFETEIGNCWDFVLQGDVGGFGVDSEFSWHFDALFRYNICFCNCKGAWVFGYKGLYEDYKDGSGANRQEYKVTQHGPYTGYTFMF